VLTNVLLGSRAEPVTLDFRVRSVKCQSIQFVVAQHRQGCVILPHTLADLHHIANSRTAVDEVATKEHPPVRMPIYPVLLAISQQLQKLHELVGTPMNVANHVIHQLSFS